MEGMAAAGGEVQNYITRLEDQLKQSENRNKKNEQNILHFEKRVASLERENRYLQEKLKLALYRQFSRHAEKFTGEGQRPLFDSGETAASVPEKGPEGTVEVAGHTRKKAGRKPLDEKLPRVDEVIDITEEEKQCACGSPLKCIGEDVTERLVMVPEQVYVLRYHVKKYACHECEGSGDEDKPAVRTGKVPENIIPGSIATPELLSYIFTKKYCDYVPYYRQEGAFQRIGVELSRQNMGNWQQQVCEKLQPLLGLIREHVRSGNVIQMDETTMAVMKEAGRENRQTSYMWLARGGPPGKPALWYEYRETREKKHITELVGGGFRGYLQSDGYVAYESAVEKDLVGVIHVGCFAHTRSNRKLGIMGS
jgi:transposase